MWRSSLVLALPIVAFGVSADAEPIVVAKLTVPKATTKKKVAPPRAVPIERRVRMHVAGVVASDAGPVVLLRDEDAKRVMPIWIGTAEAQAIQRVLQGRTFPRPLTHDLLASTIRSLGARVVDVEVSRLDGTTFIGTAHLKTKRGHQLDIDASADRGAAT